MIIIKVFIITSVVIYLLCLVFNQKNKIDELRHQKNIAETNAERWENRYWDMQEKRKMTNLERVKGMTSEELAEFICGIYDKDKNKIIERITIPAYNEDDIKEWLKSEVRKNV